jgi:plastocyanin
MIRSLRFSLFAPFLALASIASAARVTLPVAASVQGQAVFKTDVRAFNRSYSDPLTVTATYHYCAAGSCTQSAVESFSLAARQSLALDDIVLATFQLPNTQGAVVFESDRDDLVVTGRLYSPPSGPSFGQFVPGLEDSEAYPVSVLTSLKQNADFRTNVVAFNPSASDSFPATFSVFDSHGTLLGSFSHTFAPNEFLPSTALFAAAGASAFSPDNAYLVVDAGTHPLFVGAAVLDNRSQDTIFLRGEEDEAAPAGAAVKTVQVGEYFFSPRNVTVVPGTTVRWVLVGQMTDHTVTADGGAFDSGLSLQSPGATFEHLFTAADEGKVFDYFCQSHAACCDMRGTVTVGAGAEDPAPAASFSFAPASPSPSDSVHFTDTSSGSPTSWSWSFGDPASGASNTSSAQNPSHAFAAAGSFQVTLTVSNVHGNSTSSKTVNVSDGGPPNPGY